MPLFPPPASWRRLGGRLRGKVPFLYKATRCFRETLRLKMPSVKDRIASLQSSARPGSPVVSRLAAAGRRNKGANRPATARLVQSAPVDASERGEPASPYPAADELRSARAEVEALKAQVEALSTELANLKDEFALMQNTSTFLAELDN